MRKGILKSKMMLIALASILFVSCGGGGGGGGGGSSNLPLRPTPTPSPSVPKPSTPTETDPAYKFPTTSNPLDSRKGDMSALKTSLYNNQVASGASIPKDTRESDGLVNGVNEGKLEGSGVKVAILDSNFVDAPRAGSSSAENKEGNAITRRRDRSLTAVYTDVEIINETPDHPYIKEALTNTEQPTGLEHGEEVLEVVRDLGYAPNNDALTHFSDKTKPKNKIKTILGSTGWDYNYMEKGQNKRRVAAILPTQEVYEAARFLTFPAAHINNPPLLFTTSLK